MSGLLALVQGASAAIADHQTTGQLLLGWGAARLAALAALASLATSEDRCVQLGAAHAPRWRAACDPAASAGLGSGGCDGGRNSINGATVGQEGALEVLLMVLRTGGGHDLEGSWAAINLLRNLSLCALNTPLLLAAGAPAALLAYIGLDENRVVSLPRSGACNTNMAVRAAPQAKRRIQIWRRH